MQNSKPSPLRRDQGVLRQTGITSSVAPKPVVPNVRGRGSSLRLAHSRTPTPAAPARQYMKLTKYATEGGGLARRGLFTLLGNSRATTKDILPPTTVRTIKIRVRGNYGHPTTVSCSEIDVLGTNRRRIRILSIACEPIRQDKDVLSRLVNGRLFKESADECWSAQWPPEPPLVSFEIALIISGDEDVHSLRIWPVEHDVSQNIRDVTVILDHKVVFEGQLKSDFGNIISLRLEDEGALRSERCQKMSDAFGVLPVRPVSQLAIEILKAYAGDKEFGLRRIALYDKNGEWFDVRETTVVDAQNCGDVEPPIALFYDPEEAKQEGVRKKLWRGDLHPDSRILVRFREPTQITAVLIVALKPVPGPVDIGVKHIRITTDGVRRWVGRMKHDVPKFYDDRECTNVIFLCDNQGIRQKILEHAFPPQEDAEERYKQFDVA